MEFINSFVLGLGVQMAERAYIEPTVDEIIDWIVDRITILQVWLSKLMGDEKIDDEEADDIEQRDKDDQDAEDEDD